MRGLLLKDLVNLKKQVGLYIILIIIYGGMSIMQKDISFFGGMACIFATMLTITALSYDEKANWDKYALTMPISRFDIVIGKYLLGLITLTIAMIITLVLAQIIEVGVEAFTLCFMLFGFGMLILSIILPILFKFGVEKGRMAMFAAL